VESSFRFTVSISWDFGEAVFTVSPALIAESDTTCRLGH